MSEYDVMEHARLTQDREVSFPLWVKVIAWAVGLCFPIGIMLAVWLGGTVFDMSLRMARIETALSLASDDRYRASEARDAHILLQSRIDENTKAIGRLEQAKIRKGW